MKLVFTGLLACAAAAAMAQANARYTAYIDTYAQLAVDEMHSSGIPASITLAQGLLESGAGASTLAREANNHFGIKCHSTWTGRSMYRKDDDRNRSGKLVESCFRSYDDPAQSYADHSDFLVNGQRYAGLFLLRPTDYKGWAKGLKKAGYATSKTYASKLIDLIERYELHRYDRGDMGLLVANANQPAASGPAPTVMRPDGPGARKPALTGASSRIAAAAAPAERTTEPIAGPVTEPSVWSHNDVQYTVSKPGEHVTDVARRTRRYSKDLIAFNEDLVRTTATLPTGTRVYLQPKRKAFRGKKKRHTVGRGETLQQIADTYALKTSALRKRNGLPAKAEPRSGEHVYLRGRRPRKDVLRVRTGGGERVAARTQAPRAQAPRPEAPPASRTVTVRDGDTLWSVSRRTGVEVAVVKSLNGLTSDVIQPGQVLRLR